MDEQRYELIDQRLDHQQDRIELLEEIISARRNEQAVKRSYFWEVTIGILVLIEVVIGVVEIYMLSPHG